MYIYNNNNNNKNPIFLPQMRERDLELDSRKQKPWNVREEQLREEEEESVFANLSKIINQIQASRYLDCLSGGLHHGWVGLLGMEKGVGSLNKSDGCDDRNRNRNRGPFPSRKRRKNRIEFFICEHGQCVLGQALGQESSSSSKNLAACFGDSDFLWPTA